MKATFEVEIDNWDGKSEIDFDSPEYVVTTATVEFYISPIVPERTHMSNGDPGYPAEGGELEEFNVYDENGIDITGTLTNRWIEILQDQCYNKNELYEY